MRANEIFPHLCVDKSEKMRIIDSEKTKRRPAMKSQGEKEVLRGKILRLKRNIVAEQFEDNANELVSDMTESGIMIQAL